jgi:UDP-2,3-diacylglucosamine pyrophosphatase LpxH
MRLAWATDIHLNFLSPEGRHTFYDAFREAGAEAAVITGDIAEAPSLDALLRELGDALDVPVYFVLGNHDFYRGDVASARAVAARLSRAHPRLRYLTGAAPVPLDARTALVGHDGWADGRAGDFARSQVFLNDYLLISDLVTHDATERLARMQRLAREAADALTAVVTEALATHAHVIVATHVPPFREACWHDGKISDDQWAPHFTSVTVGEALRAVMVRHPHRTMEVLCGHTHGAGTTQVLPNLVVRTGGAEYGAPSIAAVLTTG